MASELMGPASHDQLDEPYAPASGVSVSSATVARVRAAVEEIVIATGAFPARVTAP